MWYLKRFYYVYIFLHFYVFKVYLVYVTVSLKEKQYIFIMQVTYELQFSLSILNSVFFLFVVKNNHDEFIITACRSRNRPHLPSIYIGASLKMWRFRAQMGGVSIKRFTTVADLPHEITPRVSMVYVDLRCLRNIIFPRLNYASPLSQMYVCEKSERSILSHVKEISSILIT